VAYWRTKAAISLKCVKKEEKLPWKAYSKSPTLFPFFSRRHIPTSGFAFTATETAVLPNFARTTQQTVLDGTNRLYSSEPRAYCRIVHHADIFAIAQLSC